MTNRRKSDPKVKEWMKTHKEEVAKVQGRYDELKGLSLEALIEMTPVDAVAKVRSVLISGIMAVGEK